MMWSGILLITILFVLLILVSKITSEKSILQHSHYFDISKMSLYYVMIIQKNEPNVNVVGIK